MTIVSLLHDITQLDYYVQFCGDFDGMVRIEFREEYNNEFYEHHHLGFPGCDRERLESDVIQCLKAFLEEHKR